jgi:hypothetical protein
MYVHRHFIRRFSSPNAFHLTKLLALSACLMAGCSDRRIEITGKVYFDDKPLTAGMINFHDPSRPGMNVGARISEDGSYRLIRVPLGESRVTVQPLRPKAKPGENPRKRPPAPPVPTRYHDPATTDLVVKITKRDSKLDFRLIK